MPLSLPLPRLNTAVKRIKNGRFVILPASENSTGHGTTGQTKNWKQHLVELLQSAPRTPTR